MFVSDKTRFQQFTFNGKRGDFILVRLEGPMVTEDIDDAPAPGDVRDFRLLYQLDQGLMTAPYVRGEHRVTFRFSEDKPMTIYVATAKPGQTGKYRLVIEMATRLPPGPLYVHFARSGKTSFETTTNYNCSIYNKYGLEVQVTGNDFLPIIEFGRNGGQGFEPLPWSERRERKFTVTGKAEYPAGKYMVRVRPQPNRGGSFDLVFLVPFEFRVNN
jgi:hypothetical protein